VSEIHFPHTEVARLPAIGDRRSQGERRAAQRRPSARDEASEHETPDAQSKPAQHNEPHTLSLESIDVIA